MCHRSAQLYFFSSGAAQASNSVAQRSAGGQCFFFNDLGYVSSADWQLEKFPRTLQKRLATPRNRSDPLPEIWHSEVCPASAEQNERPPCRSVKHWLEKIFKVAMKGPSSNQPCFEQKRRWDMVFVTTWETFPASKFQLEKFPRSLQKRRCLYFVTAG